MEDRSTAGKGDSQNQSANLTVCPCNNCSGNLEFDSAHVGETVKCPHCGMDTVLFVPQVPVGSLPIEPEPAPKPEPKRAKIVEHKQEKMVYGSERALELRLDTAGDTFVYLGGLAAGCGLIASLCNERFSWAGGGGKLWRAKLGILAGILGIDSLDGFAEQFGPKWAYHLQPVLEPMDLPYYDEMKLAKMDGWDLVNEWGEPWP